jgi:hypothetical protein
MLQSSVSLEFISDLILQVRFKTGITEDRFNAKNAGEILLLPYFVKQKTYFTEKTPGSCRTNEMKQSLPVIMVIYNEVSPTSDPQQHTGHGS